MVIACCADWFLRRSLTSRAAAATLCTALLSAPACSLLPRSAPRSASPAAPNAPRESPTPPTALPAVAPARLAVFVDRALAMRGQPYRFGGAAPGGFDCSGLVQYAADAAGITLPRTAEAQMKATRPIARRDLQAGDLVFMHLRHKELHVGIVLAAGRFVHAPSTGGHVRVDSLTAPPYAQAFVGARRLVGGIVPP